jgi:hypothetical protein
MESMRARHMSEINKLNQEIMRITEERSKVKKQVIQLEQNSLLQIADN